MKKREVEEISDKESMKWVGPPSEDSDTSDDDDDDEVVDVSLVEKEGKLPNDQSDQNSRTEEAGEKNRRNNQVRLRMGSGKDIRFNREGAKKGNLGF